MKARCTLASVNSALHVPCNYGSEYFELNVQSNLWLHVERFVNMLEGEAAARGVRVGHIRFPAVRLSPARYDCIK